MKANQEKANELEKTISIIEDKFEIPLQTQKLILQICWAQHDAQWFLKSKKKYGSSDGNLLNQEVIYSMGKIEARHVLNALGMSKEIISSIPEIFKVMNTLMDVLFPPLMKFRFVVLSEKEGLGIVEKCFIWEEVKKSKGESEYQCACNARHRGWLAATCSGGQIIINKLIPKGDAICEFRFVMQ